MPSHKLLLLNKESREADLSKSRPGWHMLSGQTQGLFPGFSSLAAFCACRCLLLTMLPASRGDAGAPQTMSGPWAEYSGCLEPKVSEDLSL